MDPVSPVIPGENFPEINFGANQPEYVPLPAIRLDGDEGEVITRWEPNEQERHAIASGGSVWLHIYTFGRRLQPVRVTAERPELLVLTPDGIRSSR